MMSPRRQYKPNSPKTPPNPTRFKPAGTLRPRRKASKPNHAHALPPYHFRVWKLDQSVQRCGRPIEKLKSGSPQTWRSATSPR
mmetsp:Transcript_10979/g.17336  ORF Transcript_10979/g.17336 Transcript_10979/m.17336 type:complete len:83 (-) Transcript_10979:1310-1558(-)